MERAPRDFEYLQEKFEVGKRLRKIGIEVSNHVGYFIQMSSSGGNRKVPPIWCNAEDPRVQLMEVLNTPVHGKTLGDALEKFFGRGGSVLKIKAHIFPKSQKWWIERWDSLFRPAYKRRIPLRRGEPLYPLEGEEKEIGKVVQWLYFLYPVDVTLGEPKPFPTLEGLVMWFNRPGQKEVRRYWEPDHMMLKHTQVAEEIKKVLNEVHYKYWGVVL